MLAVLTQQLQLTDERLADKITLHMAHFFGVVDKWLVLLLFWSDYYLKN